jgi:hypothetical protein
MTVTDICHNQNINGEKYAVVPSYSVPVRNINMVATYSRTLFYRYFL